jgi:hypothetical protein
MTRGAGMATLPPEVQEDVLDLIDRLSGNPDLLKPRRSSPDVVHDLDSVAGGRRYTVFVTAQRDVSSKVVRVTSIRHAVS